MSTRLLELAQRREHLIEEAAVQRIAVARDIEPWRTPLTLADYGLTTLRFVLSHPVWIISGVLFSVVRPGRMGKWLRYGWATWQLVKNLNKSKTEHKPE